MDIGEWLRGLGLDRYAAAFREQDIDAEILPELTAEDLDALGVTSIGHRRKLLAAIGSLAPGTDPAPQASRSSSEAERRQLTVMFIDLAGSTELSQRLDPEALQDVIKAYQRTAAAEVARFGGHMAKYMGDGVLAYFGWPRAQEDAAERAVRAGLAVTAAVQRLALTPTEPLAARVGLATGGVVVGELIGDEEARERVVTGGTPNLAARLQGLAEAGQVVIAETSRRLLGDRFALQEIGGRQLKGFRDPIRAFVVMGEGAAEGRFEALHTSGLPPLVGREQELGLLLDRWERARDGEGQVVLLAGEAGIGKSRLLRAVVERLGGEEYRRLGLYCSPFHANTTLHPVVGLIERMSGIRRDEPPERQLERLEATLALTTRDVAGSAPLLADVLGIPTAGRYPLLDLSPQQTKERTFQLLLDQLTGSAVSEPLLTLYEDVHWADPSTLELLGRVVERVQRLPVLVLVTFRPEFAPPWPGHGHVTALSLSRFGRRHGETLIGQVASGRVLPPEVLGQILARADGVPLYVEELTKTVLESGLLAEREDGHELIGQLPPPAIPATLQDSLMARLDRLASVKGVAQTAACIGREFGYALLAAVVDLTDGDLRAALGRLVAAELVFDRGEGFEAGYVFKHALVRDVAYESLLRSRRQAVHARIASALEEHFFEASAGRPELLAHHLAAAGQAERAIGYLQEASRRALARSAEAEAVGHLQVALAELEHIADAGRRGVLEFELQAALGRAFSTARGFAAPETAQAFAQAAALGQRLEIGSRLFPVLWGRLSALRFTGNLAACHRVTQEFVRLARRGGDTGHLLTAERCFGEGAWMFGRPASAQRHFERALTLYDSVEHRRLVLDYAYDQRVVTRDLLSCVLFVQGYPDRADAQIRQSLGEAETLQHRASLAHALAFSCVLDQQRDDPTGVLGYAERVRCLAEEQSIPFWSGWAAILEGWALGRTGAPDAGALTIQRALDALLASRVRFWRPYHLALLAEVKSRAGRYDQALAHVDEALRQAEETGERWYEAEPHRLRGELALSKGGDASAADAAFHTALKLARRQSARMWELRAAASLARLWADMGDRRRAYDLLAPVHGGFTEGFETPDLREAKALLDALAG